MDLGVFADEWFLKDIQVFTFPSGAQFLVSRRAIMYRSKAFYEAIIKTVNYHVNPQEGHYLERLWPTIFDCKTKDVVTHSIPMI